MKIILILLSFTVCAADISTYVPSGDVERLAGYTDLSGAAWIEGDGAAYVDNRAGRVDFPGGSCFPGGDLEAVAVYQPGKLYTVNEAKNGISVVNIPSCAIDRRFLVDIGQTGGDGIEGVEVHNGIVYVLEEVTGTIYSFVDSGGSSKVIPDVLFTLPDCNNAGDLAFNGDNIVAVCEPPSPVAVEYTLAGDFVAQVDNTLIGNAEAIYFEGLNMCIGGEPDEMLCFTTGDVTPPPPPVTEDCTVSGVVQVDIGTLQATGTAQVTCASVAGDIVVDTAVL